MWIESFLLVVIMKFLFLEEYVYKNKGNNGTEKWRLVDKTVVKVVSCFVGAPQI